MGTISVTNISDGTTIDAADVNNQINTIVNEFNGNIDNANIKSGAAIDGSKLADDSVTPAKWTNPYKFRVSRNSAANSGSGAFAKLTFDTEQYDSNSNFASGTYTVPVTGYYHFDWLVTSAASASTWIASLMKTNGGTTELSRGSEVRTALNPNTSKGGDTVQLTAGDTVEIHVFGNSAIAIQVADTYRTFFSGFLVEQT